MKLRYFAWVRDRMGRELSDVRDAHVRADTAISGAREVAFFPPMTGG